MKIDTVMKFYFKFKFFIFPAVVALSSLFLIIFAIYPQTIKLINNQKSADDLISRSKLLESKVTALEKYDEAELSRKVQTALASLPVDKDLVAIFDIMPQVVAKSGFAVTSIEVGTSGGKSGKVNSYEVKLEVGGTKALLPVLLNNLENSSRLIRVNKIELSSNFSAQATNVALSVGVLYSAVPQTFGTVDSPVPEITQKDEDLLAQLVKEDGTALVAPVEPTTPRGKANPFE